ncbi:cytochrome c biogenesis protein CcdA [Camelimonas abortus]|uniref:Cytochrome c biogenesis protein CcdA n=1 Tax=Camelimonas abortus TaxID=1017184 RepID=A0ABV7LCX8_9HYPH
MNSLAGGFAAFLQPGIFLMAAPHLALLAAEACEAPPPWRPRRAARRALLLSAAFALGFALALAVVAAGFAAATPLAGAAELPRQLGALAIVLTGLSLLASFCRPGPAWMRLPRPAGLWAGWLAGVACGLNWPPAAGPALQAILVSLGAGSAGGVVQLALYALAASLWFLAAAVVIWLLAAAFRALDVRPVGPGVFASAALTLCGLLMLTGAWRHGVLALLHWRPALGGAG